MAKRKTKSGAGKAQKTKKGANPPTQPATDSQTQAQTPPDSPTQPKTDTAAQQALQQASTDSDAVAKADAEAKAWAEAEAKAAAEKEMRQPYEYPHGDFPIGALKAGYSVRRKGWADGFELTLSHKGTRGKKVSAFFQSGTRCGLIEWKPKTIDDLLAGDWIVMMTRGDAVKLGLIEAAEK